jgi:hypothetical protein
MYVLEMVLVIVALYVFTPSDRRKYKVTDCPIFAENVTLKSPDAVTCRHDPPGLSETHTLVASV